MTLESLLTFAGILVAVLAVVRPVQRVDNSVASKRPWCDKNVIRARRFHA